MALRLLVKAELHGREGALRWASGWWPALLPLEVKLHLVLREQVGDAYHRQHHQHRPHQAPAVLEERRDGEHAVDAIHNVEPCHQQAHKEQVVLEPPLNGQQVDHHRQQ